jgi:predicted Rossmann fold flavoprotein
MEQYDVLVIGAGPAGLFCAIHAACPADRVLLLEKNPDPGKKLLLSGSGQCNITHTGEMRDFLVRYGNHGKFLKPALFEFTNKDLLAFFHERGLGMLTEETGKVFPKTRRSEDVLATLIEECRECGVVLRCGDAVTGITRTSDGFEITTPTMLYRCTVLVIATGGASYPKSGSTGDGYRFVASLGQPVTEIAPALTPLLIRITRLPLSPECPFQACTSRSGGPAKRSLIIQEMSSSRISGCPARASSMLRGRSARRM